MKDILCGLKATKDEMEKTGKNEDKSKDAIEAETKNFDRISKNLLTFMNYNCTHLLIFIHKEFSKLSSP